MPGAPDEALAPLSARPVDAQTGATHASPSLPSPETGGAGFDSAAAAGAAAGAAAAAAAPLAFPPRRTGCRLITEYEILDALGHGQYGCVVRMPPPPPLPPPPPRRRAAAAAAAAAASDSRSSSTPPARLSLLSTVTRARDPLSGAIVAIKKLKMDPELERSAGLPHIIIREMRALRALGRHPNVVQLLEVATSLPGPRNRHRGETFMVFECCEHDLSGIAATRDFDMSPPRVRSYMHQLLSALAHLHAAGWVHRDVKPTNVLVTSGNLVKLADFGLARNLGVGRRAFSTFQVVTQWYRAPELIYGDPASGFAVDVWAAGCILAELMTGQPLFTPDDNLQHSRQIYRLCGVPDAAAWPGLRGFKGWPIMQPKAQHAPAFKQRFKRCVPARGRRGWARPRRCEGGQHCRAPRALTALPRLARSPPHRSLALCPIFSASPHHKRTKNKHPTTTTTILRVWSSPSRLCPASPPPPPPPTSVLRPSFVSRSCFGTHSPFPAVPCSRFA